MWAPPSFDHDGKLEASFLVHSGPNVTVEEGSSLGGFRAKPNAPSHYSRDLGSPRDGESRPAGTSKGLQAPRISSIRLARR
jgi:hypothetical protein